MEIHYFLADLTPHLKALIGELGLSDGLPYQMNDSYASDATVNDFFISLASPKTRSIKTWRTYAEQLSYFFRFLESRNKSWRDATQDDFLSFYRIRRIKAGSLKVSARSWNVFAAASRRFYEWAVQNNHMHRVPFDYRQVQSGAPDAVLGESLVATNITEKAAQKDIQYLTEEDFRERLLPAVSKTKQSTRNTLLVRLLMRTGLRADEAIKLKISMLPDPTNPRYAGRKTCPMTVCGKGQKDRTVRVPKSWIRDAQRYIEWERADAVEKWKRLNPSGSPDRQGHKGFLFLSPTGTPLTYSAFYAVMRTAGRSAGFNFKAHPHLLRHSYSIYQLSAMIKQALRTNNLTSTSTEDAYARMIQDPLRKLQKLLGHSSITTTFIYLDYVDDIDEIVDVTLDEKISGTNDDC